MNRNIYLAGPIAQCSDVEMKGWRGEAKILLSPFEVLDPALRDYRSVKFTEEVAAKLVEDDLADIQNCSGVLACLWKISYGTTMELVYSKLWRIPTVVVFPHANPSPWLIYHSDKIVSSVSEGVQWLKGKLG